MAAQTDSRADERQNRKCACADRCARQALVRHVGTQCVRAHGKVPEAEHPAPLLVRDVPRGHDALLALDTRVRVEPAGAERRHTHTLTSQHTAPAWVKGARVRCAHRLWPRRAACQRTHCARTISAIGAVT
eukprot:4268144-Prymnesium_polylepis.2